MTSSSATAATADAFTADIDFSIWKAIAGSSVEVPSPGSRVYYFPEGHAEHVNNINSNSFTSIGILTPVGLQPSLLPFYPCRVIRVQFLADPQSEQVIAKLLLLPTNGNDDGDMRDVNCAIKDLHGEGKGESDVVSFSKILTPSDANNGGGFSVPRFCADSIFPSLDFDAEPPVQNLFITDISGRIFEFRHIYRGTPRRHLLTTGWSKFVNSKKLVAGDSVVFMRKKSTGELFVGVRRALKRVGGTSSRWSFAAIGGGAFMLDQNGINNGGNVSRFWESDKGKPVFQAVEMAAKGMSFEVLYYPRPGWADFVVNAEMVESSMNVQWNAGMRIKMSRETEDSSRMTWSHGTVSSIHDPHNGRSPWRMLQIKWDEPDILKNVPRVSPWEVEYVLPTSVHSASPPIKKSKVCPNPSEVSSTEGVDLFQPIIGLSNSKIGYLDPLLWNYTSSASMQGARQYQFYFSNCRSENINPACSGVFVNSSSKPEFNYISPKMNIGSSQSENLSPDSPSSVHYSGSELPGKVGADISTRDVVYSFRLFGKIIRKEEPPFAYIGCMEGESGKVCEDVQGINYSLDLSLTSPCSKLDS